MKFGLRSRSIEGRSVEDNHAMDRVYLFIFIFFLLFISGDCKLENLKICVIRTPRTTKYCELLRKSKQTPVSCVFREDRLSCLLAVTKRDADFGVFQGEDLYFSTLLEESSMLVVSEIVESRNKSFAQGAVVVVRKDSNFTGIGDLRGRRLCHPGAETGPDWDFLFSQYFEQRIAPANCEEGLSIYEDRIKSTSEYFGTACKAGPWVADPREDAALKRKYRNLCELCESGSCSNEEKYKGSGGAITCFRDNVGEILWGRLEDINSHLKFLDSGSPDDYYFLCDDGSFMTLTSKDPCVWLAKPWPVVGANRKSAKDVQKIVDKLTGFEHNEWEENFLHVMELYLDYIQNVGVSRTPEDYLRRIPGYLSASVMSEGNCKPRHVIKLCVTSSLEKQKCQQMSRAATSLAIQPAIDCVQRANTTMCLDSVAKKQTDVVVVPPDYLFDAIKKFKLRNLLFETGKELNDSYMASLVVKKSSGYKSLSDVKSKRLCLSRKNGVGWESLMAYLHEDPCEDPKDLSEYFEQVCGVDGDPGLAKCCPHLKPVEEETFEPIFQSDFRALRCLDDGGCDVAIVDSNSVKKFSGERMLDSSSKNWKLSDVEVLCVGEEWRCHLSWSFPNYLMTGLEWNSSKATEVYNVFYQLGQYLGRNSYKNNQMMKIFGTFRRIQNVLFRDTSTSFVPSTHWTYPNNYQKIVQTVKICSNSSLRQTPHLIFIFINLFLFQCLLLPLRLNY